MCDVFCSLYASQFDVRWIFCDGLSDKLGRFALSLGFDDGTLFVLQGFLNDELGSLRVLLSDLLGLDRGRKFSTEGEIDDGNIFHDEMKIDCSFGQTLFNERTDFGTLSQQFRGVELRDDGLENFVDDGGEYSFVCFGTQFSVDQR